jgi:hypothetical protein
MVLHRLTGFLRHSPSKPARFTVHCGNDGRRRARLVENSATQNSSIQIT